MKLLIDTNVWLDIALRRQEFYENSYLALCECIDANDEVVIAATSLKDVFYIVSRLLSTTQAYDALEQILAIATAATVDDAVCRNALNLERPDYEDGLIAAAMEAESIDGIITRDISAFRSVNFHRITPAEFVAERGYESFDVEKCVSGAHRR